MADAQRVGTAAPDEKAVCEQLQRILASGPFQQSRRRQQFLEFIVTETLAGRSDRLKGYNIGLEVFERPETFDPNIDPIVRMEAGRLRDRLREYYDTDGRSDPILIDLPKGSYAPRFELRTVVKPELSSPQPASTVPDTPQATALLVERPKITAESSRADDADSAPSTHWVTGWGITGWAPSAPARLSPKRMGMFAAAVLLVVGAGYWGLKDHAPGALLPEKPSIAVLPFDNIGSDPQWERFADGITEDIIADLSHFRNLSVIARNSTSVYKGKPLDIRQIGRNLNVKYVLEGSIQPTGGRINVTAQLIDAQSGSHVWSERYGRPDSDLFAVQNEVAQQIAATLGVYQGAVAEAERGIVRRKPPVNLTAYDTYLLGIEMKHKVTKEGLFEGERLLRKAIELDPQLARAYVALVDVQCYLIDFGLAPSIDEALTKMMDAGEKAVLLDPNDGKAHMALAFAYMYNRKPEPAAAELARAEALAPSDADLLILIAWALPGFGEPERAMALAERALILNPHYPDWYNQGLSLVYFFGKQYDKSLKYRLLVKDPFVIDYAFLAMAYASLGRTSDAKAALANVTRLDPNWNAERYLSDSGGYAEKESELFIDGARKAGLPDCVSAAKLKDTPNIIRVKSCDELRAKSSE